MIAARMLGYVLAAACGVTLVTGGRASAAGEPDDLQSIAPKFRPMPSLPNPIGELETEATEKGNPLWGIPVNALRATRERPIFSPSRRPPVAAPPAAPPPQIVKNAVPPQPDEPALNLIGVVVGNGEGYAVFLDNTSHAIVRLKTGEGEGGWVLRSVANREAVLERNHRTAIMRLPSPMGDHK